MYVPDIGSLQLGLCALPPDYTLGLMLHRFGVLPWLRGDAPVRLSAAALLSASDFSMHVLKSAFPLVLFYPL
jgi:hypothetical protein